MSDHPVDKIAQRIGLLPVSVLILTVLSFLAGLLEDPMTPFRSPTYVVAVAAIYYVSVQWGIVQGLFLSSGFLTLLLVSSVFRSPEVVTSLVAELPLDVFLFVTLAVLPGLMVEIYEGGVRVLIEQRAALQRKVRVLDAKLGDLARQKKGQDGPKLVDEKKMARRAGLLLDGVRRLVAARTVDDVTTARPDDLAGAFEPRVFFLAKPDCSGDFGVAKTLPEGALQGVSSFPASSPLIREAVKAGRPVGLQQPLEVSPDLSVNIVVPLVVNRSLMAVVGMSLESYDLKDDLEFAQVLVTFGQEVISRFGLMA